MADAGDSKSLVRKDVWVRVPPRALVSGNVPQDSVDCAATLRFEITSDWIAATTLLTLDLRRFTVALGSSAPSPMNGETEAGCGQLFAAGDLCGTVRQEREETFDRRGEPVPDARRRAKRISDAPVTY